MGAVLMLHAWRGSSAEHREALAMAISQYYLAKILVMALRARGVWHYSESDFEFFTAKDMRAKLRAIMDLPANSLSRTHVEQLVRGETHIPVFAVDAWPNDDEVA
jgi:hypothetical protein